MTAKKPILCHHAITLALAMSGMSGCVLAETEAEGVSADADAVAVAAQPLFSDQALLAEDFEGDISAWTIDGLWHRAGDACSSPYDASRASQAMYSARTPPAPTPPGARSPARWSPP